jgi:hypothetical protein
MIRNIEDSLADRRDWFPGGRGIRMAPVTTDKGGVHAADGVAHTVSAVLKIRAGSIIIVVGGKPR